MLHFYILIQSSGTQAMKNAILIVAVKGFCYVVAVPLPKQ